MNIKFIVASLIAAASMNAMAADQTVKLTTTPVLSSDNHFQGLATKTDALLSGGSDIITFSGLTTGTYTIDIAISGQNVTFNDKLSNLNGATGEYTASGKFRFYGVSYTGVTPFALTLVGVASKGAIYDGNVTITAVPEPETYGMMLGGLGLIGFIARRKAAKKAA